MPTSRRHVPRTDARRCSVLVVSHLYPSTAADPSGTFVREQVLELAKLVEVEVISGRFGQSYDDVVVDSGVTVNRVALPFPKWLPSSLSLVVAAFVYLKKVRRHLESRSLPDIIHGHFGFPDGWVSVRVAHRTGVPVVITLHGSDVNRQTRRPIVGGALLRALGMADRLIAVSPPIATELGTRLLGARIIYEPNGYDSSVFTPITRRTPRYFLFVGGLNSTKNPELLLRAYAASGVARQFGLVLAGGGPLEADLRLLAKHLGIESQVEILGPVPRSRVAELHANALALVLPSRSEGMPIAVNEALAASTPVIAFRVGGLPEQVYAPEMGILVDPGDAEAMASALAEAAEIPWDYRTIASMAKAPTWAEHAQRTAALYREVLRERDNGIRQ